MEEITPPEAHARMQDKGNPATYLDVRTEAEFGGGHPAGSHNIPVMFRGDDGQMQANSSFVSEVQAKFKPEDRLVVGCRMGGRSARAVTLLEQAGYSNLANIDGGFSGNENTPGWEQEDLPQESGQPEGRAYAPA